MKIVKVFKTNVSDTLTARQIVRFLQQRFDNYRINFDLDDCDRILRIESQYGTITEIEIQGLIARWGYRCEPLPG